MPAVLHYLIPHEKNNHRPYLLRHPALALFLTLLLTAETTLNLFYSTQPKILGFATSIYQQELIKLTNKQRQEHGLPPLKHNPKLDEAASLKAADMFADNYWAHVAPDGTDPWYWFKQVGYDYYMAGENLARDFNTSKGVVNAWMASPTHRANILQKGFTEIGMAVMNGKLDGEETTLVVQLFGTPAKTIATLSEKPDTTITTLQQKSSPAPTRAPTATPTPPTYPESIAAKIQNTSNFKPLGMPAGSSSGALYTTISPASWGLGQQIMLGALATLLLLFVIDSMVLWKKNILRENSHSLLHAGVLAILILAVIWSTTGMIL